MTQELLDEDVALHGICLYPILGMPEWHARDEWTRMGLWDLDREDKVLQRRICAPMLAALRAAQECHRRRPVRLAGKVLTLPRTGNVPFVIHGCVVWDDARPDRGTRLRLI